MINEANCRMATSGADGTRRFPLERRRIDPGGTHGGHQAREGGERPGRGACGLTTSAGRGSATGRSPEVSASLSGIATSVAPARWLVTDATAHVVAALPSSRWCTE